MKTIEKKLERRGERVWPPGVWNDEPDKRQWVDDATGLPCIIVRQMERGHLCGYVGVSKDHPGFEKDYYPVYNLQNEDDPIEVHGGLTYASHCAGNICHDVDEGEDDNVWWFGFDCAHSGDLSPSQLNGDWFWNPGPHDRYRDIHYVASECRHLARQLAAIGRELA